MAGETHAEYLGDIDIHDIADNLENTNPAGNSIGKLPKGKYSVMAHFDPTGSLLVRLELEPHNLRN